MVLLKAFPDCLLQCSDALLTELVAVRIYLRAILASRCVVKEFHAAHVYLQFCHDELMRVLFGS